MFDFSSLNIVKNTNDFFIGIRKSKFEDNFEFCLPNGFDDFPEGDFDAVRNLFFKMYRTFRKFEVDNLDNKRFNINKPDFQQEQDQTTLSSGGVKMQTEEGDVCVLYSKIKMIERVLEAYDELAISSVQKKVRRSEDIEYSQIHKYLDRAIYLVPLEFYKNKLLPPKPAKKYRDDLVKQLIYEYALQKTHNISANEFFIPYYYDVEPSAPLGELEPELNLKGITVFRANFSLIQTIYLEDNL